MAPEPKFTTAPDLIDKVMAMITKPLVDIAKEVEREAKTNAPATKVWMSMRDGRVRNQHVHADGQEVPYNLRFDLTAYKWDVEHPGAIGPLSTRKGGSQGNDRGDGSDTGLAQGHHTYLLKPRDETAGHYLAIVNCRCWMETNPEGISKDIRTEQPVRTGKKLTVTVVSTGHLVKEAEFGQVYPGDNESAGARYMGRAASTVAARRRSRR